MQKRVFIRSALRTPIGKFGGGLAHIPAADLAGQILKQTFLKSEKTPADFVFLGHARQAGAGPNPARQALVLAGLSEDTPAATLNHACGSGLFAVLSAVEKIIAGRAKNIYAGGVESMSRTPFFLDQIRFGTKMGPIQLKDGMYKDGFFCPMSQMLMGETVEKYIAKELNISRTEQDGYALSSHQKAARAWEMGYFQAEVCSVDLDLKKDECVKSDSSLEKLSALPPVFGDLLTAGNSSSIADGSAFIHLTSESSKTLAEILDYEVVAIDPKYMGLGPVSAIEKIFERNHLSPSDVALFEINEAFAAQVIACQQKLGLPSEKLNIHGGAIALGHPIGCSGARILVTLTHAMRKLPGQLGIASLCVSGGQGIAILIKSME